MNHRRRPLIVQGDRFGRLVATGVEFPGKGGNYRSELICDCGTTISAFQFSLRNGNRKSCGCLLRELRQAQFTHGLSKTRTYRIWSGMVQRTTKPTSPNYYRYGGRGIDLDPRWLAFEAFFADMGHPPSAKHSLDREKNDLGYWKTNCRWSTSREQSRNMRTNVRVTYQGKVWVIADFIRIIDVTRDEMSKWRQKHNKTWQEAADHYIATRGEFRAP